MGLCSECGGLTVGGAVLSVVVLVGLCSECGGVGGAVF